MLSFGENPDINYKYVYKISSITILFLIFFTNNFTWIRFI